MKNKRTKIEFRTMHVGHGLCKVELVVKNLTSNYSIQKVESPKQLIENPSTAKEKLINLVLKSEEELRLELGKSFDIEAVGQIKDNDCEVSSTTLRIKTFQELLVILSTQLNNQLEVDIRESSNYSRIKSINQNRKRTLEVFSIDFDVDSDDLQELISLLITNQKEQIWQYRKARQKLVKNILIEMSKQLQLC